MVHPCMFKFKQKEIANANNKYVCIEIHCKIYKDKSSVLPFPFTQANFWLQILIKKYQSLNWKLINIYHNESAKLRALRAHVPTCPAWLRAQVPTCLACLRTHVPTCLTCSRSNVLCALTC